jgi:hypothetical protein
MINAAAVNTARNIFEPQKIDRADSCRIPARENLRRMLEASLASLGAADLPNLLKRPMSQPFLSARSIDTGPSEKAMVCEFAPLRIFPTREFRFIRPITYCETPKQNRKSERNRVAMISQDMLSIIGFLLFSQTFTFTIRFMTMIPMVIKTIASTIKK